MELVGGIICRGRFENEEPGKELVGQGAEKVWAREGLGIGLVGRNVDKGSMLELVGGIVGPWCRLGRDTVGARVSQVLLWVESFIKW